MSQNKTEDIYDEEKKIFPDRIFDDSEIINYDNTEDNNIENDDELEEISSFSFEIETESDTETESDNYDI